TVTVKTAPSCAPEPHAVTRTSRARSTPSDLAGARSPHDIPECSRRSCGPVRPRKLAGGTLATMPVTLRLTHKAIGVEVRRGAYDVMVDGQRVGSVEMNDTFETSIEPGR